MDISAIGCFGDANSAMGLFGDRQFGDGTFWRRLFAVFLSLKTYNDEPVVHGLCDAITGAN